MKSRPVLSGLLCASSLLLAHDLKYNYDPTVNFSKYQAVGMQLGAKGLNTFGASAPLKELQKKFGFTPERVMAAVAETMELSKASLA